MNLKLSVCFSTLILLVASCSSDEKGLTNGSGAIKANFTADYSVSIPRTVGRDANVASVVPDIAEFSVNLTKEGNAMSKSWSSVRQVSMEDSYSVGNYQMEAYYGSMDEEGFDKPYYYGSTTFTVYDGELAEPSVVATVANTMVSIDYTDAFKKYFTDYKTTIHSSGGSYIEFGEDESRWAYVKPGNISMELALTKTNGTSFTFEPAEITNALERTHYHITFDVNGGEVGDAQLTIKFDATTEVEPITIDLSDELINAPAPTVTASGFTSDTPVNVLEGDAPDQSLKTTIMALSGLKSIVLTTNSEYVTGTLGIPAEVDLLNLTEETKAALVNLGINAIGVWNNPDKMAVIDFSNVIKNLKVANNSSTHSFTMVVKDKFTKVSEPMQLVVNAPKPLLTITNPDALAYGQNTIGFTFTYNGTDIQNKVKFQATNKYGTFVDCSYVSAEKTADNTYRVEINLPETTEDINVKAVYNTTESSSVTVKRRVGLTATDGNIWSKKVIASIKAMTASEINQYTNEATVYIKSGTGSYSVASNVTKDATSGAITIEGLTAGTTYTIKATMDGDVETNEFTFTTETAAVVPNGDFEKLSQTVNISSINQGGKWSNNTAWSKRYTTTSLSASEPTDWASVNAKTACTSASNMNTWFVIPSSYSTSTAQNGSNAMTLRNVAWDVNGSEPGESTNWSENYCKNIPSIANRSAGKLFLGSYTFDKSSGTETYNEGVAFTSRPVSLSGYYTYTRDSNDGSEKGTVVVTLLNGNTVIGKGSVSLDEAGSFTNFTVPITYTNTALKATTLRIMITSSDHNSYTQSEETASIKTTNYCSASQQCSYGAILTVDNLTFAY